MSESRSRKRTHSGEPLQETEVGWKSIRAIAGFIRFLSWSIDRCSAKRVFTCRVKLFLIFFLPHFWYSSWYFNCWFASDVILPKNFFCIDHQHGRLVTWMQTKNRARLLRNLEFTLPAKCCGWWVSKSRLGLRICWPVGWVKLESHIRNCLRCGHPWDPLKSMFGSCSLPSES